MTVSQLSIRFLCGVTLRKYATNTKYGPITNVKLQRISFMVWHLEFEVAIKE